MRVAEAVAAQDAKAGLELVAELAADGVDLRRFVSESLGFFRGMFLAHYAPNLPEISDEPPEVYDAWKKAASMVPPGEVLRAVDLLAEALVRLREGREERLMTELAMIKLTRPETATDPEALIARMDRLERRMGKPGETPAAARPVVSTEALSEASVGKEPEDEPKEAKPEDELTEAAAPLVPEAPAEEEKSKPAAIDISFEQLQKIWPGLFGSLRDVLGAVHLAAEVETVQERRQRERVARRPRIEAERIDAGLVGVHPDALHPGVELLAEHVLGEADHPVAEARDQLLEGGLRVEVLLPAPARDGDDRRASFHGADSLS